ncbi:MAG: MBL fold metallo-hydrolase [Candidatus Aenigmatarchaeota archaeon]
MPVPIEITILGSGSAIPTLKRGHPAVLMHRAGDYFLLDCGEGAQLGLEKAGVSPVRIDKIFITHWHADHFAGLLPLLETMHLNRRTAPLEIYGPDAKRFVNDIRDLSYWSIGFRLIARDCGRRQYEKLFSTSDYEMWAIKTKHNVPSCGYAILEKPHWAIDVKKLKKFGLEPGPDLRKVKSKGKVKVKNITIRLSQIAVQMPGRRFVYSGDTLVHRPLFKFAKGAELLIRLELENVGAVDVGPYIGKQIQVEGYLHDEEPQHPWIDVRVLKLAPAY